MKKKRNTKVIVIAVIISIVLYIAGLFSGLSFNKVIEQKTERDIGFLVDYVDNLDNELQSIQVQELFINNLDDEAKCEFADTYFSQIESSLSYYWDVLPVRLEQYEQGNELSDEYIKIKRDYTRLSLRAWIISRDNLEKCNSSTIPLLYFYSTDCEDCVKQGEILDDLKTTLAYRGKSLLAYTIDFNSKEPTVGLIKKYYGIQSVPAIVVNERALQGNLITQNEILLSLNAEDLAVK